MGSVTDTKGERTIRGNMWRPILRGVKISGFLLAIVLISSVLTIQTPRPAKAEGVLYTVGCLVKGLLSKSCPSKTEPQPSPVNEPDKTTNDPSNTDKEAPATSTASSATSTLKPIVVDEDQLKELPQIRDLSFTSSKAGSGLANAFPIIRSSENDSAVLGASDPSSIQPTSQGWQVAGILWYWWLAGIIGAIGLAFLAKGIILNSVSK